MKHLLLTTIAAVVLVGCGTGIYEAAAKGNIEVVKQHLAAGTDVNAKDEIGNTPLHWAADAGHKEIVELLIAKGADLNEKDNRLRKTPLDAGHSPLAAVTLLEKNVAAGNPGMWIGSTDGNAEQVWLNGEWILDVKKGIDTGKSYPKRAEWIHSIAAAVAEPTSQHPQTRIKGIIQP